MNIQHGKPVEPGLYAARQYYGWRILEWHEGEWWHERRTAKWGSTEIEAFLGPLPVISKDFTRPPLGKLREMEASEYDL